MSFNKNIREQSLSWPDSFYLETDAKKREELLKARLEQDDSEENRIRYQLLEKRYMKAGRGIDGTDYYMKILMTMEQTADLKDSFLGKRSFRRGLEEIRDRFCLDLLQEKPEYTSLWKDEFLNLWCRYIEACKNDKNYTGIVMGLGQMSDDRLIGKMSNDIDRKTLDLPEKLGLSQDLATFREAAQEAFQYYFS